LARKKEPPPGPHLPHQIEITRPCLHSINSTLHVYTVIKYLVTWVGK
jgi:hypothetical protein